ncbi:MAG: cell division protein ZapE, partial [Alphaproteobacteria bacterium]|nr:cell division protein ZapE [Alphaproteobacteria bacterium]
DSQTDYREAGQEGEKKIYFTPLTRATDKEFQNLFVQISAETKPKKEKITIKGREIKVPRAANGAAMFDFKGLCGKPLAAEDYLALANKYHSLFLSDVSVMEQSKRNELKRFILLIDCFYEAGGLVVITAQAPISEIYTGHDHQFELKRTISRLHEMQTQNYLSTHEEKMASWA